MCDDGDDRDGVFRCGNDIRIIVTIDTTVTEGEQKVKEAVRDCSFQRTMVTGAVSADGRAMSLPA